MTSSPRYWRLRMSAAGSGAGAADAPGSLWTDAEGGSVTTKSVGRASRRGNPRRACSSISGPQRVEDGEVLRGDAVDAEREQPADPGAVVDGPGEDQQPVAV